MVDQMLQQYDDPGSKKNNESGLQDIMILTVEATYINGPPYPLPQRSNGGTHAIICCSEPK